MLLYLSLKAETPGDTGTSSGHRRAAPHYPELLFKATSPLLPPQRLWVCETEEGHSLWRWFP